MHVLWCLTGLLRDLGEGWHLRGAAGLNRSLPGLAEEHPGVLWINHGASKWRVGGKVVALEEQVALVDQLAFLALEVILTHNRKRAM